MYKFKKNKRPINLDIITIKFPITAVASILHRISGVFLFMVIGPVLWFLKLSLSSENEFTMISDFLFNNNIIFNFLSWITITTMSYHAMFGIRQILMDCGFLKQTLFIGKISVKIIFIVIIFISIYVGIYIWNLPDYS